MNFSSPFARRRGFTLMEILVVIAIILVLAAILIPAIMALSTRAKQAEAIRTLQQLSAACITYAGQHDGQLPVEDAPGPDTWNAAAKPENSEVWYNALPHLINMKGVGDYATSPRSYYAKGNLLFSTGATYPPTDVKLRTPLFAFAINSKIERKLGAPVKAPVRLGQITNAAITVAFLEQGLPGEKKAMDQQGKYDGAPKGTAKSFVARYSGRGVIGFFDGHAESVQGSDILTETGAFPFPQTKISWTKTPDENPNK